MPVIFELVLTETVRDLAVGAVLLGVGAWWALAGGCSLGRKPGPTRH